jgi:aminopeptidase
MPIPDFDQKLERYADLIVKVGLNLRAGQRLMISNPSTRGALVHTAPLVRKLAASAYRAGARLVDVVWGDEAMMKIRLETATRDTLTEYPTWQIKGMEDYFEKGDAFLSVRSNNPDLLGSLDPELVSVVQKTHLEQMAPYSAAIGRNAINWCVATASGVDWAVKIFPDLAPQEAEEKLWQAIFNICRVDQPDPVAAWKEHIQKLVKRAAYLEAKQYDAFHYKSPGTDLMVGMPKGYRWISARMTAQNGVDFTANIPTEETFCMPHCDRVDGTVCATMPLSYGGALIEDFNLTFEKGRVVKFSARKGETILKNLIETDEGSARLGEVALVPYSSPISKSGILFYDPLIDENASCHLAFGRAYKFTMQGGDTLSDDEFRARGGNVSMAHVDFMIGSAELDIDGIRPDGSREPVFRRGEWAFDV